MTNPEEQQFVDGLGLHGRIKLLGKIQIILSVTALVLVGVYYLTEFSELLNSLEKRPDGSDEARSNIVGRLFMLSNVILGSLLIYIFALVIGIVFLLERFERKASNWLGWFPVWAFFSINWPIACTIECPQLIPIIWMIVYAFISLFEIWIALRCLEEAKIDPEKVILKDKVTCNSKLLLKSDLPPTYNSTLLSSNGRYSAV